MWYKLIEIGEWFGEMRERYSLIKDFNRAAKRAFISSMAPSLLVAKITQGDSSYKHTFSKWMGSGFRIKALSGKPLKREEMVEIGKVVLDNEELVRKLIALGWDTLEVHDNAGVNGLKWELSKFAGLGGYLS